MDLTFSKLDFLKPELGAEYTGQGTHFALFSAHAEKVELCLFSNDGEKEVARMPLPEREGDIWTGYIEGIKPGVVYGYRVHGPYEPRKGHRFNPNKLLLDPYAKQIIGSLKWDDALYGYTIGHKNCDMSFDHRDSAAFMPKAVVEDPEFDWSGEEAIRRPWTDTIIYEAHVRGLTMTHPKVPDAIRGTFKGMAHPATIDHIASLGVSAIELLPIQHFINDRHLIEKGLTNYWGYQPLGYFAPEPGYLSEGIGEFKAMVKAYHAAGIEVIMDVVYNHTGEGSERGPTLSFRGIDNLSYYLQSPDEMRHTFDTTGTGNTLNVAHPMVMRMVLDSLRYWVTVMHVDGFRFDLASTLGREGDGFDRNGGFFDAIRQDPVLAGVKLIAEPWDIGEGGYQLGGFPHPFREWNDQFRDDVRRFWRQDQGVLPTLAERVVGSPIQFDHSGRAATSSINFLSAHDGFTLSDVVAFDEKHNDANGEDNQDGHSNNNSHNLGAEGATEDRDILAARTRRRRAMMATLMFSQGVPMLLGGDELSNSQNGNNNSYCQDNEIGWIDWDGGDPDFFSFCRAAIEFRGRFQLLRHDRFMTGEVGDPHSVTVQWLGLDGRPLKEENWHEMDRHHLVVLLTGHQELTGTQILLVFNAGDACELKLPEPAHRSWQRAFDSSGKTSTIPECGEVDMIEGQSVSVFLSQAAGS
ncbi:hypothetical protein LPJGGPFB_05122 [Ensifer adhaerens]|uniref:glycogen debranching protein GlgX n=1 Tax=Ensifer adhaerens TaxID=106592 RepID=UPI001567CA19|nr:glycogen debranching protein GlgX [Ensifer adhaerens]NRP21863.1 hypothetical protein [Ensifer adhaerens]